MALTLCIWATPAFLPAAQPVLAPTARHAVVQMDIRSREAGECFKVGTISSISGSVASAPVKMSALLMSNGNLNTMDFGNIALAMQLALFGVMYRWAVRSDDNDSLKQVTVGAFALIRALASTPVSGKMAPDVWIQVAAHFGESALAFGLAAAAVEYSWAKGWGFRLPGYSGLPAFGRRGYYEDPRMYEDERFTRQMYRDRAPQFNNYEDRPPYFDDVGNRGRVIPRRGRDPLIR